jgi:hypothetical protein
MSAGLWSTSWKRSEKWTSTFSASYGHVDVELLRHHLGGGWGVHLNAYSTTRVELCTRYRSVPANADLRDVKAMLPELLKDIETEVEAGLADVMP